MNGDTRMRSMFCDVPLTNDVIKEDMLDVVFHIHISGEYHPPQYKVV